MKSKIATTSAVYLCICLMCANIIKVVKSNSSISQSILLENIEALTSSSENDEEKMIGYQGKPEGENCTITGRTGNIITGKRVHCYYVGGYSICFENACGMPSKN